MLELDLRKFTVWIEGTFGCGYFLKHNKFARCVQHFDQFPVVLLGKRHGSLFRLLSELATKLSDRFTTVMGFCSVEIFGCFWGLFWFQGLRRLPAIHITGSATTDFRWQCWDRGGKWWGHKGHLNSFGTTSVFGLQFDRSCVKPVIESCLEFMSAWLLASNSTWKHC